MAGEVGGGGCVLIKHMAVRFERAYRFASGVPAEDEGPSHIPTSLALKLKPARTQQMIDYQSLSVAGLSSF